MIFCGFGVCIDPCRGGIACEICLGWVLLSFAGTEAGPRHRGQALRAATPTSALQTGGRWGFCTTRSLRAACRRRVGPSCSAIPPVWWRRGRRLRWYGRRSADPLGEKSPKPTVLAEWVCVLADVVSVVARWSHVNPLLRAATRYIARKPAIENVGGAAQARISGLTCA